MHQFDHNDLAYAAKRYPDIIGWIPDVRGKNGKINPHLTRFVTKRGSMVDVFHVKPIYYETLTGHWRPLSEVCEHYGNHRIVFHAEAFTKINPRYLSWLLKRQELLKGEVLFTSPIGLFTPTKQYLQEFVTVPRIGLTTTTVYPDPATETTTFDGAYYASNASWATVRALSSSNDGSSSSVVRDRILTNNNATKTVYRNHFGFDTSPLSGDEVDSATFSFVCWTKNDRDNDGVTGVALVETAPVSNNSISNSDYGNFVLDTALSETIRHASVVSNDSTYNDMPLNASGLSVIDINGVSNFGLVEAHDQENDPPAGGAGANNQYGINHVDQTGTTKDPKLVVEHTASAGPTYNALAFCAF